MFDRVYAFEPVPAELEPQYAGTSSARRRQKGPENVEYQAFPRLSALAEVVWTPADRKQYEDYLARLGVHHGVHQRRLEALDVNFRPLDAGAGSSRP